MNPRLNLNVVLWIVAALAVLSLAQVSNTTTDGNSLITLPPTFTNHGNPKLLCQPTKWTDLLTFFVVNYFAHAATVITKPGCSLFEKVYTVFFALLLPGAGAYKALLTIANGYLARSDSELRRAAKAGALCMMVEMESINAMEERINTDDSMRSIAINGFRTVHLQKDTWLSRITGQSIHGYIEVPEGYRMVLVPADARFTDEGGPHLRLCSNYSVVAIAVGLAQTLFGIATLYNTRGDQVERFGYAAFGLTVAPYALMSVLNGIAALCMPNYPSLFLVESRVLTHQTHVTPKTDSGIEKADDPLSTEIKGAIATLAADYEEELLKFGPRNPTWSYWFWRWTWLPTIICIAIVGGISHFDPGSSSVSQRGWVMSWIVVGGVIGNIVFSDDDSDRRILLSHRSIAQYLSEFLGLDDADWGIKWQVTFGLLLALPLLVAFFAPAVGGMITVGQMLNEYGICQEL